jgi:VPDSG-CTERM motif
MKRAALVSSWIRKRALVSLAVISGFFFGSGPLMALSTAAADGNFAPTGGSRALLSDSSVSSAPASSVSTAPASSVSSAPASSVSSTSTSSASSTSASSASGAPASSASGAPATSASSAPTSVGSASTSSVNLGTAGPQSWSVLEIGTSQVIGLNTGGPPGAVAGNVGINQNGGLQLTDTSVQGNVVLGTGSTETTSGTASISGSITTNQTLLSQTLIDSYTAWRTAGSMAASAGGIGITSINATSNMTLQPGVYNLSSFNVSNGANISLAAGGSYVFNISGGLTLNGPGAISLASGLSLSNVLFNITGTTGVQLTNGGNAPMLYGIILSPYASINIAPGNVIGEIIGGQQIQIVSSANPTTNVAPVPDSGSSAVLMSLGLAGLLLLRGQKFLAS